MLSEIDVNNLITPFELRQKALEQYVIRTIAKRVNEIGKMLPSDIHKLERLYKSGADVQAINRAIANMTGLQIKDIKKLIKVVAQDSYIDAKPYYDYRRKPFIPLSQNIPLQKVINAVSRQTQNSFKNLSNSQAIGFLIRDRKHPKRMKFYTVIETYQSVIDEAIQAVLSGTLDYQTTMRRTIRQLNNSGMRRMYWESGYSQRMDTAVKRNILDGVKQISQEVHKITGEQFGADGIELTAHPYPAPDHAPFQGRLFTNKEFDKLQDHRSFKDIKGNNYPAQERIIGQYNCKHFAYPVILAATIPTYTEKQLKDILKQNEKGVTLPSGEHLTGYEAIQYQNKLALKVRQLKDAQMVAQEAGDMKLAKEYQTKVTQVTKHYNIYNKKIMSQLGVGVHKEKLSVVGYRRISVK